MEEGFIIHYPYTAYEPDDLSTDLDALISVSDVLAAAGKHLYVSGEMLDEIKKMVALDPQANELSTSLADKFDILTRNAEIMSSFDSIGYTTNLNNGQLNISQLYKIRHDITPIFLSPSKKHDLTKIILICQGNNTLLQHKLKVISDRTGILQHLAKGRNYHFHPKHGENNGRHWSNASSLLCSEEHAQELLNSALVLKDENGKAWNYDCENHHYICFRYEGDNPDQQWHGYHITDDKINTVPEAIKRLFPAE